MNNTLIVISQPPSPEPEALELAMALAAFDQPVSLLFTGAGVLWLQKDWEALVEGGKAPSRIVKALPMYDCEEVYACSQALQQFAVAGSVFAFVKAADVATQKQLYTDHQHCLRF